MPMINLNSPVRRSHTVRRTINWNLKMNEQDFINEVRRYAMDHYNKGGWDEVVEAWSDGDILEYYSDAGEDVEKAFKAIKETVQLRHEYAKEIRSTAF